MRRLKSIMLVDDDEVTNLLNQMIFKKLDVTEKLLIAQNGKKALDLLVELKSRNENIPEIIFLDINMPVMNGFEFLAAYEKAGIHEQNSVIIMMLTTSVYPKDLDKAKHPYISGFLSKPLTKEMITDVVNRHF